MSTIQVGNSTSAVPSLHGFDAVVVRAGHALAGWGQRHAARRLAAGPQLVRLHAQARYAEQRRTLTALAHSQLHV